MLHDLIRAERQRRKDADETLRFINESSIGDSFVNWRGPIPDGDDAVMVEAQLKRQYTSYNLLSQICGDHVNAVLGRELTWKTPELDQETDEALTEWFTRLELQELLQEAAHTLLVARSTDGNKRAPIATSIIRGFIPKRAVRDGRANFSSMRDALLSGVRFMHPEPSAAGMLKDADGETLGGYYLYREQDANTLEIRDYAEVVALDTEIHRQEWGFKDEHAPDEKRPLTVVQIRTGQDYKDIQDEQKYPLAGELTMFEMSRRPFVTDSMLEQQMSLNANETYMNMGGGAMTFLERIFTNTLPPGEWVDEVIDGRSQRIFKPFPFNYGPATVNFLQGAPQTGSDGRTTYATPGVHYHEPSGPAAFTSTSEHRIEAIYGLANMRHKLMSGDAVASGVARQQAVQDFISSLSPTVTQVKGASEWLLRLALNTARYLSNGKPYAGLKIDPVITLSAVQPTPDEMRLARELYEAGVISLQDAMRRVGVEDEEALLKQMELEKQRVKPPDSNDETVTPPQEPIL